MKKHRTAIIGCGGRAHGHAKAYQLVPNAELVACANRSNLDRRQNFAQTYGITGYANASEMIQREHPDLVHLVAMPNQWVSLMQMVSEINN